MPSRPSMGPQPTRSSSTHLSHSHNVPLSARRSAPLDLATVERRGQSNAPREPSKRIRPHGIPEAPTFRPTEEEFKDPVAYIQKIAPEGRKYGICRVIPPDNWQPSFAIDTEVKLSRDPCHRFCYICLASTHVEVQFMSSHLLYQSQLRFGRLTRNPFCSDSISRPVDKNSTRSKEVWPRVRLILLPVEPLHSAVLTQTLTQETAPT